MMKIIKKLREWLILKLGGYVIPPWLHQPYMVAREEHVQPHRLVRQMHVNIRFDDPMYQEARVKMELAYYLAEDLVEEGYISFASTPHTPEYEGRMEYRATLWAIHPKERE